MEVMNNGHTHTSTNAHQPNILTLLPGKGMNESSPKPTNFSFPLPILLPPSKSEKIQLRSFCVNLPNPVKQAVLVHPEDHWATCRKLCLWPLVSVGCHFKQFQRCYEETNHIAPSCLYSSPEWTNQTTAPQRAFCIFDGSHCYGAYICNMRLWLYEVSGFLGAISTH